MQMFLRRWLRISGVGALIVFRVPAWADEFDDFRKACQALPSSKLKMERCLALAEDGKVSKKILPQVYQEVAFALFEFDDFAQAIKYTRTEIEIASENFKAEFASGKLSQFAREALPKQMSFRYKRLGQLQAMARLKYTKDESDEAYNYAKSELSSYSMAIGFDSTNYSAYMKRAQIQSLLCKSAEAFSDKEAARRIARNAGDARSLREYESAILPSCQRAWQER